MIRGIIFKMLVLASIAMIGCVPNKPSNNINFSVDLSNSEIQKAFEAGYTYSKDTLYKLFRHSNPTLRYLAVRSFSSNQDSTAIDSIVPLLKDPDENVRVTAAFVLGQIGIAKSESHLVEAFQTFDSLNTNQLFNATILEALGKCGMIKTLTNIANVKSYKPTDSIIVSGQAKSLYRFARRDMVIPQGTIQNINFLTNTAYPYIARLYAAHYMAQAKIPDLRQYADTLIQSFHAETSRAIKLPLAIAIAKSKTSGGFDFLSTQLRSSQDRSIRYALLQQMSNYPYADADTLAEEFLKDSDPLIARAAATYLIDNGISEDASRYFNYFIDPGVNKQAHIELLTAINKHMPYTFGISKNSVNEILKDSLLKVEDVYRKTDVIKGLAWDVTNFLFIRNATNKAPDKVMRVAGLEAMGKVLESPFFPRVYKSNFIPYKKQILSYLLDGVLSADAGLVSTASIILRNPVHGFKSFFPNDSLFHVGLAKIKMPEGIEAYDELATTISYWNDVPKAELPSKNFRLLDWAVLNNITDSTKCEIVTNKGSVILRLMPTLAPATVANWVELTKSNYFIGKPFHRVVPNFVIQNGCNRGDGFGALPYTIRSEFTQINYDKPGMVGMASLGPNTESNQFFITHVPTPQLDGRYTIFAEVVQGLDIVANIERGDKILKLNIK